MGFKFKKAFKKITKIATGGALGGGEKAPKAQEVAPVQQAAAAVVEAPKDEKLDDDADTEAAKKAARAKGKKGLSVARSGGTGLNI